jgi:hypothetical protein
VPKAATPFQWLAMNDAGVLKEKMMVLQRGLAKVANTRFTHDSIKYSFLQGVLARGDRRLKEIILRLSEGEALPPIMRESVLNLGFYATRERKEEEVFPWDFIGPATRKKELHEGMHRCLGE